MDDTFFKVWRRLLKTDLWLGEIFTRGQAWVDLIGLANWAPGIVVIRGVKVQVQRGQVSWTEVALAERWRWSRGKVRRFLSEMKEEQQTEQQGDNRTSLITILNYSDHQGGGTANGTAMKQQQNSKKTAESKPPSKPKDCVGFYPIKGGEDWGLTKKKFAQYVDLYTGMDVKHECKKAKQWLVDNPLRQKTARGMTKFLGSWLERSNNSGRFQPNGEQEAPPAPPKPFKAPTAAEQAESERQAALALQGGQKQDDMLGRAT